MKHSLMYIFCLVMGTSAWARPEYAVRYGINRCTACHYSPAGGGPRNQAGKYFGAFGYKSNKWIEQDYAGAEMKLLYYRPERTAQAKGGLGLMNGSVWGSLPLQALQSDQSEVRLLAEQNLGGFSPGPRQWYVRVARSSDTETSWWPQYILVGRIIPAFGIMTDEHRTYVRLQTGTPWNTGFDTGVMLAANPFESLHYDLAAVNGEKNSGGALATDMANVFGAILNLRWLPTNLPFALGASGSWYSASTQADAATAVSLYGLLSLHRLTGNRVPMTVSLEFAQAKNWNDSFSAGFVNDPNYASTVSHATSHGYYSLVEYEVSQHFVIQAKFDQLLLDRNFPADAARRYGLGVKHYFANNMWGLVRFEKAEVNHPAEVGGLKTGALGAVWGLINISI